ncbi:serine protease inhibitor 42Dd-like [Stomoxys calcitrans]|uniref:serine protease inhibitor 42Dd-like n=1 Tax=Stomoxys calcitrans TaxID=35570 RepID=UPI0027E2FB00|nr:serine protease inhibitor 42Dd-like [Stomoxys calcitrans]
MGYSGKKSIFTFEAKCPHPKKTFEMKLRSTLFTLAMLLSSASSTPLPNEVSFYKNLNEFTRNIFFQIFQGINEEYGEKNIIFSPFSIQTCLAMARMGATGRTAAEMDQRLGYVGQSTENIADNYHRVLTKYRNNDMVKIANKFYVMKGYQVQNAYNQTLATKFFSSAENIDFSQGNNAECAINAWIKSSTNNAIEYVLEDHVITSDTRLLLLSLIYFQGTWKQPFDPSLTTEQKFYTDEKNSKQVSMMYRMGQVEHVWLSDLEARAIRLPYQDTDISMIIVLPNARNGLSGMLEKFKSMPLESLAKSFKFSAENVEIHLPKFKAAFDIELKELLKKMGFYKMFVGAEFANLLTNPEPLAVDDILHKAVIEVNEVGTKAAAATAIEVFRPSMPIEFKANHPFFYAIVNADSVPLFTGIFVGL